MLENKQEEIVNKLNNNRATLLTFFEGLDARDWETAVYHEDITWTFTDILRHLVDAERGMTGLIIQWQQGKDPVPPDFDLARWNNRVVQKTAVDSPAELLSELAANRSNLLSLIKELQPEDWGKQGRHGSLRIMNIEQVCHLIADHELSHLDVMEKAIKDVK